MNPLDQYPSVRRFLYFVQWVTTGLTGVAGVVFVALNDVPLWYTITVAVLAFVWSYTGLTAQSNVTKPGDTTSLIDSPNLKIGADGIRITAADGIHISSISGGNIAGSELPEEPDPAA